MSRVNKKRVRGESNATAAASTKSPHANPSSAASHSLTLESLQQLTINQSHGVDLEQCLQHAISPSTIPLTPLQQLPASPLAQTPTPTPATSPAALTASMQATGEVHSASSWITRPLSHSIGIRSLTFNRMACDLAVATSDTLFIWKSPTNINRYQHKLQNELNQIITSSPVVRGRNKKQQAAAIADAKLNSDWHCEAILPLHSLPLPAVASMSSPALAMKPCTCPWLECPNHDESRLKQDREQSNFRSSSSVSSSVVQFSPDESKLFVAVNRMMAIPKNSPLFATLAAASSPVIAASAAKSSVDLPLTSSHSQQLEADIEAMLAGLNASPLASALNTTQLSELQSSPASSIQDKSKKAVGKGKTKKSPKQDESTLVPSYAVYLLDVRPTFLSSASATNSSQPNTVIAVQSQSMPNSSPPPVDSDMDPMLAELIGEMSEEMESPPAKGNFSASNKCSHIQTCFAVSHAVTSLLSFGRQEALLVGDAAGVVSMWECTSTGTWNAKKSFSHPSNAASTPAVKSLFFISDSSFVTVYENADLVLWNAADHLHPVRYVAATIQSSTSAATDVDTNMTDAESKESESFVASPTYSPEHSQSLGRSSSSTHTQSQIIVPETQSQMIAQSLSTSSMKDLKPAASVTTIPNAAVTVHSIQRIVTDAKSESSNLRLLLLLSPSMNSEAIDNTGSTLKLTVQSSSTAPSSTPAASGRRSSRKSHVDSIPMPSPLCKSSLPILAMLELHLDESTSNACEVNTEQFTLPLLLTDDNPSTHVTAIASSCARLQDWQEKSSFDKSTISFDPPVVLAGGLSSGGLVLYSANSNSLLGFMSEDAPPTASQMNEDGEGENPPLQLSCEALLPQKHRSPLFASVYDQEHVTPIPVLPTFTQEKPSAANSPRVKTSQQSKKRKTTDGTPADVSHSLPSGCPSCSVPSNSKHVCRRAVTSLAFHPTLNLFAVGDQLGHVHVFCGQSKASN